MTYAFISNVKEKGIERLLDGSFSSYLPSKSDCTVNVPKRNGFVQWSHKEYSINICYEFFIYE